MKSVIITVLLAISALAQAPKPGTIVGNSGGGGGGGTGTVTSVTIAGTANQITATGTCVGTVTITCTLSLPSGLVLPGTVNGLAITTTTGTITIASAKVLTVSNSLTLAGTDGVTLTFPTTSATIARTDAGQTFTGNQTMTALLQAGSTAPTQTQADNSTKVATTAYVDTGLATKGAGTVTTVSVATANGLSGTVANPTTTPALTLSATASGDTSGPLTALVTSKINGVALSGLATGPLCNTTTTGVPSACPQIGVNPKLSPYNAKGDGILLTDGAMAGGGGEKWTCSTTCFPSGFIVDYSGVNATPIDAFTTGSGSTTPATAPTVTTASANEIVIRSIAYAGSTLTVTTGGVTQRAFQAYSGGNFEGIYAGEQLISSAGASGTALATVQGGQPWAAMSIALVPSGSTTFRASSTNGVTGGSAIAIPEVTGAVSGDVQIACVSTFFSGTVTKPTGWTLIGSAGSAGSQQNFCYWRVFNPVGLAGYTLTSAGATFSSGDIGKAICVDGAAVSGESCGLIAAFTDANDVVLNLQNANIGAISSKQFIYATDDTAAMQAALTAACNNTLLVPVGIFGLSSQLNACTTGATNIYGSGATLPNYFNLVSNVYGGASITSLWWLTKSMTASSIGLSFGNGLDNTSIAVGNAIYRYPSSLNNLSVLAGVTFNNDGGCSTCSGVYVNLSGGISINNIVVSGWGRDGVNFDTTWRGTLQNSFIHKNGRYGVQIAASNQNTQNIALRDNDISANGLEGVFAPFVTASGVMLTNNIIQWNNQLNQASIYEVKLAGGWFNIQGNWFEQGNGHAVGPINPNVAGAAGQGLGTSFVAANVITGSGTYAPTFAVSGCSSAVVTGTATSGQFSSGSTASCTFTVTMGPGQVAQNVWACPYIVNLTTPSNTLTQNVGSSTYFAAVFTGSVTSGDNIAFACFPR